MLKKGYFCPEFVCRYSLQLCSLRGKTEGNKTNQIYLLLRFSELLYFRAVTLNSRPSAFSEQSCSISGPCDKHGGVSMDG